jgi:tetrahydromethanopterin S-methyltransferase subunit B
LMRYTVAVSPQVPILDAWPTRRGTFRHAAHSVTR